MKEVKYNKITLSIQKSIEEMRDCVDYTNNNYIMIKIAFLSVVQELIKISLDDNHIINFGINELDDKDFNYNLYLDDYELENLEKLDLRIVRKEKYSLMSYDTDLTSMVSNGIGQGEKIKNIELGNIINLRPFKITKREQGDKTIQKSSSYEYFITTGCEYLNDDNQKNELAIKNVQEYIEIKKEEYKKEMESKVATIVKKMSNSVSVEFDDVVKNKKMILKSREECLFYLNHFINRAKEEDDYYTETYDVDLFHFVFDDRHLINKLNNNNISFIIETTVEYFLDYDNDEDQQKGELKDIQILSFEHDNDHNVMGLIDVQYKTNIGSVMVDNMEGVHTPFVTMERKITLVKSSVDKEETLNMYKLLNY